MCCSENFSPPYSKDNGFDFMMHTFTQATECDTCGKLLAGCFYQGYLCSSKYFLSLFLTQFRVYSKMGCVSGLAILGSDIIMRRCPHML